MCKTAWIVELVFEAIILIVCGIAWAIAGFPHAAFIALGFVCFGAYYVGTIWNLKKE